MRISTIQAAREATDAAQTAAIVRAVAEAVARGAELVAAPCALSLSRDPDSLAGTNAAIRDVAGEATVITPCSGMMCGGTRTNAASAVGSVAVLCGDEALDAGALATLAHERPDILVWQVEGESALQAEAIREHAISVSETVASLVLVASMCCAGEVVGATAIIYGGEVLAEADESPAVLTVDVTTPLAPPDRHGEIPTVSPILAQRLAVHEGHRAPVDYPADLS